MKLSDHQFLILNTLNNGGILKVWNGDNNDVITLIEKDGTKHTDISFFTVSTLVKKKAILYEQKELKDGTRFLGIWHIGRDALYEHLKNKPLDYEIKNTFSKR